MKLWQTKPLGEIVQFSTERIEPAEQPDQSFNYVGLEHIESHTGRLINTTPVNGGSIASTKNVFHSGQILYGKLRPYLNKVYLAAEDGICSTDIIVLKPQGELLPAYAAYYLRSPETAAKTSSMAKGANLPRLAPRDLASIQLPIPPLNEQRGIVAVLDQAENLRTLRHQADYRTADLIPALFHDMFGKYVKSPPVVLSIEGLGAPNGWQWAPLTDLARLATGHTPSRKVPEYWDGNIPWITLTDIRALDGKVATETTEATTEAGVENSSAVKLPKGTVCFSRTASVGFVTIMGREMCTSQDFVNWVCGPELDPEYLMGALMFAREHLRTQASGSTHRTIYFPVVERFCLLVPPLPLQKQFAAAVADIRDMQQKQAASKNRLDDLFHSLLHRAFRGEL
ncbi:MAG: restriction endonuclease subunit S [Phycisphaerae bacterium]